MTYRSPHWAYPAENGHSPHDHRRAPRAPPPASLNVGNRRASKVVTKRYEGGRSKRLCSRQDDARRLAVKAGFLCHFHRRPDDQSRSRTLHDPQIGPITVHHVKSPHWTWDCCGRRAVRILLIEGSQDTNSFLRDCSLETATAARHQPDRRCAFAIYDIEREISSGD